MFIFILFLCAIYELRANSLNGKFVGHNLEFSASSPSLSFLTYTNISYTKSGQSYYI